MLETRRNGRLLFLEKHHFGVQFFTVSMLDENVSRKVVCLCSVQCSIIKVRGMALA